MKRPDMDVLGEGLRRRRLSAEEVQGAVDRAWGSLQAQADAVPDEVLRDLQPFRRASRVSSRAVWLAAAAVLAVASLVSLWPRGPYALLENGDRVAFSEVFRAPDGTGAAFTLADGSHVELRSSSEITLESSDDGVRIRLNRGSVIVTAAKQRHGHLYVVTKDLTVSVVGTVFLVSVEAEGSRVAVIEGEVNVQEGEKTKTLLAGEQVSTAPTMAVRSVAEEISWSRQAKAHMALRTPVQVQTVSPPPVASPLEFDVAAIHPSQETNMGSRIDAKNDRVTIENMNLKMIIRYAYDVRDYQISGPGILTTARYSVQAKAPPGTPNSQLYPMLQSMLVKRFKMVLKRETRETPVYALRETKDGIKVKALDAAERLSGSGGNGQGAAGGRGGVPGMVTSSMTGTMEALANSLSRFTDRPVVDRTGLTGRYTIFLGYVPESALRDGVLGPSLDMALEELGLKLERIRAPMEFLEVEDIGKPSEN